MVTSLFPLRIQGASIIKRGKRIIGPIELDLESDGITAVIGPNGSGKTTLLRMLHGIENLANGTVSWGNFELSDALKHQAFVFQNPIMLRRSVLENMIYPLHLKGMTNAAAIDIANKWLERVGLSQSCNKDALVLSGGERQRLALARALACEPKILFLDEPTSNLDGYSMAAVEKLILDASSDGIKVIIATHDFGQLKRLADTIIFMLNGKIHEIGNVETLLLGAKKEETSKFLNGEIVL
jgi:tungstate transport system ATP-binding protein